MALVNGSFEEPGANPGEAAGWVSSFVSSVESYDDFSGGIGPRTPTETFGFGWNNSPYFVHIGAVPPPAGPVVLAFTVDHATGIFTTRRPHGLGVNATVKAVGPGLPTGLSPGIFWVIAANLSRTTFELSASIGGAPISLSDDGDPSEGPTLIVEPVGIFTVDPLTGIFTTPVPHGFALNTRVEAAGQGLPTGLSEGPAYWVIATNLGTYTFQLSASMGGSPITLTDSGDPGLQPTIFVEPGGVFIEPAAYTFDIFNSGVWTSTTETFLHGWSTDPYFANVGPATADAFSPAGGPAETFDAGWNNDSPGYKMALDPGDETLGVFSSGHAYEDFESGWGNDSYAYTLGGGSETLGMFGSGPSPQPFESFEHVTRNVTFVGDVATSVFSAPAHGFANSLPVVAKGPGLPAGVVSGLLYWIINATTDTFQLAPPMGLIPITITSTGDGTSTIAGDPKAYWPLLE